MCAADVSEWYPGESISLASIPCRRHSDALEANSSREARTIQASLVLLATDEISISCQAALTRLRHSHQTVSASGETHPKRVNSGSLKSRRCGIGQGNPFSSLDRSSSAGYCDFHCEFQRHVDRISPRFNENRFHGAPQTRYRERRFHAFDEFLLYHSKKCLP